MGNLEDLMALFERHSSQLEGKGLSTQDLHILQQMGQMLNDSLTTQQKEVIDELIKTLMGSLEKE
ncbi:MAG: hypothetical protein ACOYD6_04940 [Limnochordia bacterium]|jgi:hypothetical protein